MVGLRSVESYSDVSLQSREQPAAGPPGPPPYSWVPPHLDFEVLKGPWQARDKKQELAPGVFRVQLSSGLMLMRKDMKTSVDIGREVARLMVFHRSILWAMEVCPKSPRYYYAYFAMEDKNYVSAKETGLNQIHLALLRIKAAKPHW